MESSLCEKPERHASRRLSDHLVLEGQKQKVHSLVDKVYSRKNLKLAWERVRANQGASGADKVTIAEFETRLDENLERLHQALRENTYQPQAVRRLEIPKRGAPGKTRPLGIPSVYDRVCQQALANRLEPIFEKVFDPSSFGYRKGRKTADALTKIWREVEAGNEWIVDADLKDYFGSVDHEKLMTLIGKQIADSRVLILIQQMLKAGYKDKGRLYETPRGTPQGGVVSPLLSNILLTPFDKEMRHKGYQLTRWAVIIAAGEAYTIAHGRAFLWSEQGYQAARLICRADGLLTPPSTLLAIRAGYRPVLHPDIEENPHF